MTRKTNKKVSNILPHKLYHFMCEDEKSMRYYLKGLSNKFPGLQIKDSCEGNCISSLKKKALMKFEEYEDSGLYEKGFEVVICFDKDNNTFESINDIISNNKLKNIFNNPCYEYWLILHLEKTDRSFTTSRECVGYCRELINKHCKKKFENDTDLKSCVDIFTVVGDKLELAIKNAKELRFTDINNTFTNFHNILEQMQNDNDGI